MSDSCNHDCNSCGENCASRTQESFLEPLNPQSTVGNRRGKWERRCWKVSCHFSDGL